ncbi:hypothetical protein PYCC9005_004685 [Savitreella phatthalungensis]
MKNSVATAIALAALIAPSTAFQWPTEKLYNNWHETKLERWLKDHKVPFPEASDRQALYDTVEANWNKLTPPYDQWSESQLRDWLVESGQTSADLASAKKDELVKLVQSSYSDAANTAEASTNSLSDWILDSWTDSQLKSFLDYHKIPNPSPRNRDSLLSSARSGYSNLASIGPSMYDTLFGQWTDSDLKAWADARGIPVPQGSTKESILASFRKNTKSLSDQAAAAYANVFGSGSTVYDTWSESKLKQVFDENGIPVPQGSKINELRALARKNSKSLRNKAGELYEDAAASAGEYADAASKKAQAKGQEWSKEAKKQADKAAKEAKKHGKAAYDSASEKAAEYGDKASKEAKKQADKAAKEAKKQGKAAYEAASDKAAEYAAEGKKQASKAYDAASDKAAEYAAEGKKQADKAYEAGSAKAAEYAGAAKEKAGAAYADARAKAGEAAAQASEAALGTDNFLFNAWSDSKLKAFLDARGVPVPQNGKKDEIVALARKNARNARISADDFAGWSNEELNKFAKDAKIKLDSAAAASRDELERQTAKGYAELKKQGNAAAKQAEAQYNNVKAYAFDSWSSSDLKAYLDSYGVSVPQNGAKDELIALARKHGHYFANGQTGPVAGSPLAQIASDGLSSLFDFVKKASGVGYQKAQEAAERVKSDL